MTHYLKQKWKFAFNVASNDHCWLHIVHKITQNACIWYTDEQSKVMMSFSPLLFPLIAPKHVINFCSTKMQIKPVSIFPKQFHTIYFLTSFPRRINWQKISLTCYETRISQVENIISTAGEMAQCLGALVFAENLISKLHPFSQLLITPGLGAHAEFWSP